MKETMAKAKDTTEALLGEDFFTEIVDKKADALYQERAKKAGEDHDETTLRRQCWLETLGRETAPLIRELGFHKPDFRSWEYWADKVVQGLVTGIVIGGGIAGMAAITRSMNPVGDTVDTSTEDNKTETSADLFPANDFAASTRPGRKAS